MSKSATSSAKLINLMQARVERLSRQSLLPDERSPGDAEYRSVRESAPSFPANHQAGPDDYDLGDNASNLPPQLQEPQWPLLEMKAAIRDLEYRIVRELRGSQSPEPAAADLEREVFRIGRRLEELNDRVEELRRSSHRQSTPEYAPPPLSNTGSHDEMIVDIALRVDSALAFEQDDAHSLDSADKAKAEVARCHATARRPVAASILASLEKTADELRFAQSTWRRNLFQKTCASQNEKVDPTTFSADLLSIELQPPELDPSHAAGRSVVRQQHGDVRTVVEEMRGVATENVEQEMRRAMGNRYPTEARLAPRVGNQLIEWELSSRQEPGYKQWAHAAFMEETQLFLLSSVSGIEIARAHIGLFLKPLKGASVLAIAGLILFAGGSFLFRPGSPFQ
ncbi:MAG: hypothetical protein WAK01_10255, partial [Methylocystis sp.]